MTALLPETAPFSTEDIDTLNTLVARATPLQRSWLSGFLAGIDAASGNASQPHASARVKEKLTILYGSETGNAESLALKARKAAQKLGFDARILDMADARLETLATAKALLVIVSTWGEGDPPQRAATFYKGMMAKTAPNLESIRFAVLALGDTAYANFCATGCAVDERLAALGATRIIDRVELDLDFAKKAASWTEASLAKLQSLHGEATAANIVHVDFKSTLGTEQPDKPVFDAARPFEAEITESINLNGTGSSSETWHIELATDATGWSYKPGDAIGVVPQNDPELVANILEIVGLGSDIALARQLVSERDVTTLTRPLIQSYANLTNRSDVERLAGADTFPAYVADRQVVDLIAEHPEKLTAEQILGLLRPLPPRLYSVASSIEAHPGETHLLVGAVRWQSHDRARRGVASTYLSASHPGDIVKLYVKPNRHFRLPKDSDQPIIMIGAGTGIAPFRAFVEQRAATTAKGKSWLIFGARNYRTDFLYQLEWQDHLASGTLSRLDVAFSQDQPEKIYVQHRIAARADELRGWVGEGAVIYVCGDEKSMARDVDNALTAALGVDRLDELRQCGRYLRDVY